VAWTDRARSPRPAHPFDLPPIYAIADLTKATGALLSAVAAGDLTPSERRTRQTRRRAVKAIEATELSARLAKHEDAQRDPQSRTPASPA
jgi:hypothetical protein